jgi:copper chaperone CopZ
MNTIQVVNIKCGGCRKSIMEAMQKESFSSVEVNIEKQEVSFEGDVEKAKVMLSKMGYPEADSEAAKSLTKKAKSYVSCALGKM